MDIFGLIVGAGLGLKKFSFIREADAKDTDIRLDQFIANKMEISRSEIRKWISRGSVYLNGKRVSIASKLVFPGASVQVFVSEKKDPVPQDPLEIIFEDEFILAINKPSGLPSQPTLDSKRDNVYAKLKAQYPEISLHHRLDKDTSGVMIFGKKKEINPGLAALFKDRLIQKIYWVICEKTNQSAASIKKFNDGFFLMKNFLGEGKRHHGLKKYQSVRSGGMLAVTQIKLVKETRLYAAFHCELKTGRTHQIRVHLSELGFPVLGDRLYGSKTLIPNRIMLHASRLKFTHPVTGAPVQIVAPLPITIVTPPKAVDAKEYLECLAYLKKS